MKTTIFCVTILCLELASSFPYPDPLSSYGSYEPVGVPDRVSQPIQISNLAHSQNSDLTYKQQQLAYLQQENIRRQNHENILRDQDQQRLANQHLIQPQPEHNYNNPIPLNTVREPYPPQRPIQQPKYKAPITQQYYQHQQFREPYQGVEAPPLHNVPNPQPQAVVEPVIRIQPNYSYSHPVPDNNGQNVLYDPRIQQALASTPLKKRYLVLHPNGTIEHIDKIDQIVERHPNYILVNAGDLPKSNVYLTPTPANPQPLAPVAPVAPEAKETVGPVAPVAPVTPVVYPLPSDPVSTIPAPPAVTTGNPTVTPPPVVTATATAVYPPPSGSVTTTSTPDVTTAAPTVTPPSVVTATATAEYPPPSEPITTSPSPANVTVTPAPEVCATSITVPNQPNVVANATVNKLDPSRPDFPFEPPTNPVVWFRTKDLDFWDKLTSGKETYDIVYFFNVPREPRVTKDTKTVIYANGTVLEEQTQTICDDEDSPPRVIKTTKVTNPDDTQPKT